jgi:hypothetical protein
LIPLRRYWRRPKMRAMGRTWFALMRTRMISTLLPTAWPLEWSAGKICFLPSRSRVWRTHALRVRETLVHPGVVFEGLWRVWPRARGSVPWGRRNVCIVAGCCGSERVEIRRTISGWRFISTRRPWRKSRFLWRPGRLRSRHAGNMRKRDIRMVSAWSRRHWICVHAIRIVTPRRKRRRLGRITWSRSCGRYRPLSVPHLLPCFEVTRFGSGIFGSRWRPRAPRIGSWYIPPSGWTRGRGWRGKLGLSKRRRLSGRRWGSVGLRGPWWRFGSWRGRKRVKRIRAYAFRIISGPLLGI